MCVCDCQVVRSRADAKRELLQVQQKAAKALTILRNSFQVNGVKKTLSVTYHHTPDPHSLGPRLLPLLCAKHVIVPNGAEWWWCEQRRQGDHADRVQARLAAARAQRAEEGWLAPLLLHPLAAALGRGE